MRTRLRIGKRAFCLLLVISVVSFVSIGNLQAQDYPTKPINVVIPLGAGGQNDLTMRIFSNFAKEYLGQPFVIRIVAGGGGAIGSNEVAQSKPDGYTLLAGHANCNSVLPAIEPRGKGPDDLEPIAMVFEQYSAYFVQQDAPWKNFKELLAWAKANPGKLVHGNNGTWSSSDFSWRWLEMNAGFTSRNVPHPGGAQCTMALLGGHIQIGRLSPGHSYPHWRAGKIRPLFVAGSERLPDMPNITSLLEEGYDMKGLGSVWIGIMAPKGTPKPIINKLAEGFKKMTQDQRAIAAMKNIGAEFVYRDPDEFGKVWHTEFEAYKALAKIVKK